jgi:hypothetical protein
MKKKSSGKVENGIMTSENEQAKLDKAAAELAKLKCFNWGEKGCPAKTCLHKEKQEQSGMCSMMVGTCCNTHARLHKVYEVCLDNGSQVSIVNLRLLIILRMHTKGFQCMSRTFGTDRVGYLEVFFCQLLSLSDIEDIYPVTYIQGKSFMVHMVDRDVIFTHRDKMFIADFLDWIISNTERGATY